MVSTFIHKIMMWNCRVTASKAFRRVCLQYLQNVKPSIMVILETHTAPTKLSKTFKSLGFDKLIVTGIQGYSGGIAMEWKSDKVKVEIISRQFLVFALESHFQ